MEKLFHFKLGTGRKVRLQNAGAERMRAEGTGLELVFHRDGTGVVRGFELNAGRVRKIEFRRIGAY
jgi:hypothetical protein